MPLWNGGKHATKKKGAPCLERAQNYLSCHNAETPKSGVWKVCQHTKPAKIQWEAKKRGQMKREPDSSCMEDEFHIQNVPSLADVKSHKMAHYWDTKGVRWSNRLRVDLKQNDKGWNRGRWHGNIQAFWLAWVLDHDRIQKKKNLRRRGGWKHKFCSWIISSLALCA